MKTAASLSLALTIFTACSGGGETPTVVTPVDSAVPEAEVLTCAAPEAECGGRCVDTSKDRENCGACGTVCPGGEVCVDSKCAIACPTGQTECGGKCVTTATDRENCGACGKACGSGEVCSAGACGLTCGPLTTCGGDAGAAYCANVQTDNANCGACGVKCASGEACVAGKCELTCGSLTTCGGGDAGAAFCANLQTDNANCGSCGTVCPSGQVCSAGKCSLTCGSLTTCSPDGGTAYCANLQSDNANCGACGTVCGTGTACSAGSCATTCGSPLTKCGDACVDTRSSLAHCGACDTPCSGAANASPTCASSTCGLSCNTGFRDCDGNKTNGCEVNLATDVSNCGACGAACSVANGTPKCVASSCGVATCNAGFGDCDGNATNGCEVALTTSTNCGLCGNVCGSGTTCVSGVCTGWTGSGASWTANGKNYGRYTWAQAGVSNNGRANAETFCTSRGGTLARPNSQAEWDAIYANTAQDSLGWWIDGHNNFTCGTATPSTPKTYQYGSMYAPTTTSLLYTGCNCNSSEQGLVVYRYSGASPFDGCQGSGGMVTGLLGAMDEELTYNHGSIVGFICAR